MDILLESVSADLFSFFFSQLLSLHYLNQTTQREKRNSKGTLSSGSTGGASGRAQEGRGSFGRTPRLSPPLSAKWWVPHFLQGEQGGLLEELGYPQEGQLPLTPCWMSAEPSLAAGTAWRRGSTQEKVWRTPSQPAWHQLGWLSPLQDAKILFGT